MMIPRVKFSLLLAAPLAVAALSAQEAVSVAHRCTGMSCDDGACEYCLSGWASRCDMCAGACTAHPCAAEAEPDAWEWQYGLRKYRMVDVSGKLTLLDAGELDESWLQIDVDDIRGRIEALATTLPHLHRDWALTAATSALGPGLAPAAHLHHDWAHPGRTCTGISVHRGRICRRSCLGSRNCRRYRKWCVTARRAQTRHALRDCAVEIAAGEVGVDRARGVVADSCVHRCVGLTREDAMCQSMREWTVSCVRMDASRRARTWSYACR